ncbi:hypothetical protein BaRGS_00013802 [Batillaria attramentaria]|uniref:Uncharacterized protein n=1 Tax=Batillaria attramentaria TaxID=370345 RepID=A0ABD0L6H4_9CAEN
MWVFYCKVPNRYGRKVVFSGLSVILPAVAIFALINLIPLLSTRFRRKIPERLQLIASDSDCPMGTSVLILCPDQLPITEQRIANPSFKQRLSDPSHHAAFDNGLSAANSDVSFCRRFLPINIFFFFSFLPERVVDSNRLSSVSSSRNYAFWEVGVCELNDDR